MECNINPSAGHLLEEMPRRTPIDGTFELTVRCNLHCKMCLFRHDDGENPKLMAEELSTEQWVDLAKQAAQAGTISLLLTGGEPMLRSDFCELYEDIYKQGFLLTLYTNATLVTPEIMATLWKYPPHKIGVTIYGVSPETYGRVCGNPTAFEKMLEGVDQLVELPSIIDFRTTIIKDNYEDADAIEGLVHTRYGEQYRLTQTRMVTKAVRGACADVTACRLEPEDNVRLAFRRGINIIKQYVGDRYDEKNLRVEHRDLSKDSLVKPRLSLFGCNAGMSSYTISWDGKLLGCQMLGAFAVDTQTEGFLSAWERFPSVVKLPSINESCLACESLQICNCCFASRYAETGDLGGRPEYVCRDTAIIQAMINKEENKDEC